MTETEYTYSYKRTRLNDTGAIWHHKRIFLVADVCEAHQLAYMLVEALCKQFYCKATETIRCKNTRSETSKSYKSCIQVVHKLLSNCECNEVFTHTVVLLKFLNLCAFADS